MNYSRKRSSLWGKLGGSLVGTLFVAANSGVAKACPDDACGGGSSHHHGAHVHLVDHRGSNLEELKHENQELKKELEDCHHHHLRHEPCPRHHLRHHPKRKHKKHEKPPARQVAPPTRVKKPKPNPPPVTVATPTPTPTLPPPATPTPTPAPTLPPSVATPTPPPLVATPTPAPPAPPPAPTPAPTPVSVPVEPSGPTTTYIQVPEAPVTQIPVVPVTSPVPVPSKNGKGIEIWQEVDNYPYTVQTTHTTNGLPKFALQREEEETTTIRDGHFQATASGYHISHGPSVLNSYTAGYYNGKPNGQSTYYYVGTGNPTLMEGQNVTQFPQFNPVGLNGRGNYTNINSGWMAGANYQNPSTDLGLTKVDARAYQGGYWHLFTEAGTQSTRVYAGGADLPTTKFVYGGITQQIAHKNLWGHVTWDSTTDSADTLDRDTFGNKGFTESLDIGLGKRHNLNKSGTLQAGPTVITLEHWNNTAWGNSYANGNFAINGYSGVPLEGNALIAQKFIYLKKSNHFDLTFGDKGVWVPAQHGQPTFTANYFTLTAHWGPGGNDNKAKPAPSASFPSITPTGQSSATSAASALAPAGP